MNTGPAGSTFTLTFPPSELPRQPQETSVPVDAAAATRTTETGPSCATTLIDRGRAGRRALQPARPQDQVVRVIGFYDGRGRCPNSSAILPQHGGQAGVCIGLTLQAYRNTGGTVRARRAERARVPPPLGPLPARADPRRHLRLARQDPEPTGSNIFPRARTSRAGVRVAGLRAVGVDVPALARARGRRRPDPLPAADPGDGLAARAGDLTPQAASCRPQALDVALQFPLWAAVPSPARCSRVTCHTALKWLCVIQPLRFCSVRRGGFVGGGV